MGLYRLYPYSSIIDRSTQMTNSCGRMVQLYCPKQGTNVSLPTNTKIISGYINMTCTAVDSEWVIGLGLLTKHLTILLQEWTVDSYAAWIALTSNDLFLRRSTWSRNSHCQFSKQMRSSTRCIMDLSSLSNAKEIIQANGRHTSCIDEVSHVPNNLHRSVRERRDQITSKFSTDTDHKERVLLEKHMTLHLRSY